jgi:iron complex transport system ATP-binding protein
MPRGLDTMVGERGMALSGGQKQRVTIARALVYDAPVLVLDEPTAHLDLRHQARLLSLARDLARQEGLSVLMAMHDLNLAALYSERVALLVGGELRATGTPSEVLTEGLLSEAFRVKLHVSVHPEYGTPLILPDGQEDGMRTSTDKRGGET